jgi:DNA-binding MarR family transcriptional regulator/N-acetylglutamate synthase-like GNAT family acetyltransferase
MPDTVADIRSFNRQYTTWVGALDRHHLGSEFSLAEVRVLYELANRQGLLARDIADRLKMDAGYLSRILGRFERAGLVERQASSKDGRAITLSLTNKGRDLFGDLDRRASARMEDAIGGLDDGQRARLTSAMGVVGQLIQHSHSATDNEVVLRQPRAGDYGWAVERHGVIYDAEFGWGPAFEGLVAELFGKFAQKHDPERERCWIAELNGERVGCVFLVEREPEVAQLRCLLVEPKTRGHGAGARLVNACIEFARDAGYRRMMLWTNKGLDSARKIYESAGFRLVEEQPHTDFGPELMGQSWEMDL